MKVKAYQSCSLGLDRREVQIFALKVFKVLSGGKKIHPQLTINNKGTINK